MEFVLQVQEQFRQSQPGVVFNMNVIVNLCKCGLIKLTPKHAELILKLHSVLPLIDNFRFRARKIKPDLEDFSGLLDIPRNELLATLSKDKVNFVLRNLPLFNPSRTNGYVTLEWLAALQAPRQKFRFFHKVILPEEYSSSDIQSLFQYAITLKNDNLNLLLPKLNGHLIPFAKIEALINCKPVFEHSPYWKNAATLLKLCEVAELIKFKEMPCGGKSLLYYLGNLVSNDELTDMLEKTHLPEALRLKVNELCPSSNLSAFFIASYNQKIADLARIAAEAIPKTLPKSSNPRVWKWH